MAKDNVSEPGMVSVPMATIEELTTKLMILKSNIAMITGGGQENFSENHDEVQDYYLMGCLNLASECTETVEGML